MKFRGEVTVALKEGIFDPQGAAVHNSLKALGYDEVEACRMGKHILLYLDAQNQDEALRILDEMARRLLANPVTEVYQLKVSQG